MNLATSSRMSENFLLKSLARASVTVAVEVDMAKCSGLELENDEELV